MTDTFVQQTDQTATQDQNNLPAGDQAPAGGGDHVDTKSPEYQLNVLQKRVNDKDEFIETLKRENQETREMYASLEERLKNIEKIEDTLNKQGQQQDVNNQDTGLDENELVGKVIENLNKKQAEEQMDQNYNAALSRLNNEFGEQHIETKVQEAARQNGLSVSDMVQTARKSPQAFYKLMGLEGGQQQQRPASPTRSNITAPSDNSNEKDFAYYARMMRENPREYWKPDTQREFRKLFQQNKDN